MVGIVERYLKINSVKSIMSKDTRTDEQKARADEEDAKSSLKKRESTIDAGAFYLAAAKHWLAAGQKANARDAYSHAADAYTKGADYLQELQANTKAVSDARTKARYAQGNADELGRVTGGKDGLASTLALVGLISSMFFLSFNLTGNVIGSLNPSSSHIIGSVLFFVGLVGAFFYFRGKKK